MSTTNNCLRAEKILQELTNNLRVCIEEWDEGEKNCFNLDHLCDEWVCHMRNLLERLNQAGFK